MRHGTSHFSDNAGAPPQSAPETHACRCKGPAPLAGTRVLLAEDEAFLALDLYDSLEEAGAQVIGPIASLTEAMIAARREEFDAAILDIDLQGNEVFPVASFLVERHIPFLFHTAHSEAAYFSSGFSNVPICTKPADPSRVIHLLCDLLDSGNAAH